MGFSLQPRNLGHSIGVAGDGTVRVARVRQRHGVYIVARDPQTNLRIKITGDRPDYSLEMDFDVEPQRMDETRDLLFENVFTKLLPAAGATDLRPAGKPISGP